MPLGERLVRRAAETPDGYARKVRLLAAIYGALNAVSLLVIGLIIWRGRHLVTLAQRSNVETLVLAIILVLALYYVASTHRGLLGGLRMLWYNLPLLWGAERQAVEARKHRALAPARLPVSVSFDRCVVGPDGPASWELADDAGSLGRLSFDGPTATLQATKAHMNASVFEYLLEQILIAVRRRDPAARLEIAFWDSIDDEAAAVYRSTVAAFEALGQRLGGPPLWPTLALSETEVAAVGAELHALVPALRDEAFLPDLEYQVEYSVPILPEPLAFVQLRRVEQRADPVLTMGYAALIMSFVLAITALLVAFPPWVPSK